MSVFENPKYLRGTRMPRIIRRAKDSITFQAGQPMRNTDSGVAPCRQGSTSVQYLAAETQATATSSTDIKLDAIQNGTHLKVYCTNNTTDTKALATYIGANYGMTVNSCVATVNTNSDTNVAFYVHNIASNLEEYATTNDTSDSPSWVDVTVIESVRTAEGDGY